MRTATTLSSSFDLLGAIEAGHLALDYQPIVEAASGRIVSLEALVRWPRPGQGRLRADEFLPLAEHSGLGGSLTAFVLRRAIRDCARWLAEGLAASVAVNVSPSVLGDDLVPAVVASALDDHGVDPRWVTVEITERAYPHDPVLLRDALVALARLGVHLSLDDFGTGESSLARLQQLHFDEIKIDRSFVSDLAESWTDREIVRHTTALAHALGCRVVAEGIDRPQVLRAVRDLGVDRLQGYLLARPAPLARLRALRSLRANDDWPDRVGGADLAGLRTVI